MGAEGWNGTGVLSTLGKWVFIFDLKMVDFWCMLGDVLCDLRMLQL